MLLAPSLIPDKSLEALPDGVRYREQRRPVHIVRARTRPAAFVLGGTTLNVLIIYAHPEPKSFTGAMRDVAVETLRVTRTLSHCR